jgi:hypothetical protein
MKDNFVQGRWGRGTGVQSPRSKVQSRRRRTRECFEGPSVQAPTVQRSTKDQIPKFTGARCNFRAMDSLAPARSALAGFWLRPDSFRRLPGGSSHKIGFPKPAADGFPLCKNALSRKAGNVNLKRFHPVNPVHPVLSLGISRNVGDFRPFRRTQGLVKNHESRESLTHSLPLVRPSRACGFAHIPFGASQAPQVDNLTNLSNLSCGGWWDKMARNRFWRPKIKANQGKSSPRAGNFFTRPSATRRYSPRLKWQGIQFCATGAGGLFAPIVAKVGRFKVEL